MLTQITQTALLCLERAEYLGRAIRIHLSLVGTRLTEFHRALPPRGEGEAPWPDWIAAQEANLFTLKKATDAAHQASQIHSEAKVQVGQTLKSRNNVVDRLTRFYRSLRSSILAIYGPDVLPEFGLADVPAKGYLAAREQCRMLAKRLGMPDLLDKLGEPLTGYSHPDFAKILTTLLTVLNRYEQIVSDLTDDRKLRDEALVNKEAAVKNLKGILANVARVQEGYARMAGLDELANRIRLTIPQSSKPTDQTDSTDSTVEEKEATI